MPIILSQTFQSRSPRPIVHRVRAFQFATVVLEWPVISENGKPAIACGLLDRADKPGIEPFIAMELNSGFWIITDLERWQQYKRYSPGPLADGTGGVLQTVNGVKLGVADLEVIKTALAEWES